jgi:NADH dehydrogenase
VLPLARPRARFAPIFVHDVADAFVRALSSVHANGKTYELCGPEIMTLADIVRTTAEAAGLPCHVIPLPDFVAAAQGILMDFLPGKPFTYDNYKSLTIDSVCQNDGCASLGIQPAHMRASIAGYLRDHSLQRRLDIYRRSAAG